MFGDDLPECERGGRCAAVKLERYAGIEMDTVEGAPQRSPREFEPEPMGAERTGKHQGEPGGTVLEVLAPLLIGDKGVGMVQALQNLPGRSGRTAGNRLRVRAPRVKRLDPQAVIGFGDQLAVGGVP